ncbi:MAG: YihY/virulence factor BrkB family protein [Chitinophagaceae bacterium]|nr:MAG: YihY/virulence factor BrkB family protein [Chitinophagaceae bacterium]
MKDAYVTFRRNEPLRLAGATAFFATFALPPILIIITQTLGLVFEERVMNDRLAEHLQAFFGPGSVKQIMETLQGFRDLAVNWYIAIGGFIFLMFVATTLFKIIRESINQLWRLRTQKDRNVRQKLIPRLKAMIILVMTGVLFVAGLLVEAGQAILNEYIRELWSNAGSFVVILLNQVVSLIIVTIWFGVLFRLLPEGRPKWKIAFTGALFTGVLFTAGKLILGFMLTLSNIQNIYGAAGSFVLVLLFIFYVSFIFYYGAMFTYCWAENTGNKIAAGKHAYRYNVTHNREEE